MTRFRRDCFLALPRRLKPQAQHHLRTFALKATELLPSLERGGERQNVAVVRDHQPTSLG
jgi:hypothetical protein